VADGSRLSWHPARIVALAHDVAGEIRHGKGSVARTLGLIGIPTSMGAFAPGQEKGPTALRNADLLGRLSRSGVEVADHGDAAMQRWRPDKVNLRAQNLAAVAEVARETAGRVREAREAGHLPLVLGGDCTVELGTVAGFLDPGGSHEESLGLIYFDIHPDLNVPSSVGEGALDWMGVAHMLGVEGASELLSRFGPRFPLLEEDDVYLFSYGPEQATEHERGVIERRKLRVTPVGEVAADPEGAAARALAEMEPRYEHLLVHFDVDTVDFTDLPLSENPGRNEGLPFDVAMRALGTLLWSGRLGALTVTEFNPDHGEEDGSTARALAQGLVDALAGPSVSGHATVPPVP
jgi:arginase